MILIVSNPAGEDAMGARGLTIRTDVPAAELRRLVRRERNRAAAARMQAIAGALEGLMWTAGARQRISPRLDAPIGSAWHRAATARLREAPRVRGIAGTAAPISVGERSGRLRPHMGHLLSSCDDQLIRQSPAVSERRPGLSPSLSRRYRTGTTSHSVGAQGSRTMIPPTAGRAQEGETILRWRHLGPCGVSVHPPGSIRT